MQHGVEALHGALDGRRDDARVMRVRDVERPERPLPLWFQHCPPRSEGECYYSAFPPWEQLLQLPQELLVFLVLPLVGVQEGLPGAVIRPGETYTFISSKHQP